MLIRLGILSLLTPILLLLPSAVFAQSGDGLAEGGLISNESAYNVEETVIRLIDTLEAQGLTVMGTVDHGANAAGVFPCLASWAAALVPKAPMTRCRLSSQNCPHWVLVL